MSLSPREVMPFYFMYYAVVNIEYGIGRVIDMQET